ncbi:MAG: hypothetical protein H0U59_00885 [Gemmatimonadaceae bacterium]|nr:hypothetical protein [Gemmatimonadaceae bacterium]
MPHYFKGPFTLGANLERIDATAQYPLGTVAEGTEAGGTYAKYRYVKFVDAVTYVLGHSVSIASATTWDVTNDRAGGASIARLETVGVVFQTVVPTQNTFGWVQIAGIADVLVTGAAIIAGDYLMPAAATDGAAEEAVEGTDENILGVALATIASAAVGKVMLMIRGA